MQTHAHAHTLIYTRMYTHHTHTQRPYAQCTVFLSHAHTHAHNQAFPSSLLQFLAANQVHMVQLGSCNEITANTSCVVLSPTRQSHSKISDNA